MDEQAHRYTRLYGNIGCIAGLVISGLMVMSLPTTEPQLKLLLVAGVLLGLALAWCWAVAGINGTLLSGMHRIVEGIVLRETETKETDKILTVLTRTEGKFAVVARCPAAAQPHCRRRPAAGLF